jgi:hypothetical protein
MKNANRGKEVVIVNRSTIAMAQTTTIESTYKDTDSENLKKIMNFHTTIG